LFQGFYAEAEEGEAGRGTPPSHEKLEKGVRNPDHSVAGESIKFLLPMILFPHSYTPCMLTDSVNFLFPRHFLRNPLDG